MKKSELAFNLSSIAVDVTMLLLAAIIAFYTRLHFVSVVGPVLYDLNFSSYLSVVFNVLPVLLFIFSILGLYNLRGTRKFIPELGRIILGTSVGLFLVIIMFFFRQSLFPSRFIILAAWVFSIVFVVLGRLVLKEVQKFLFIKGYGLHKLIIINGNGLESGQIESHFKNSSHGYRVVKELHFSPNTVTELEVLVKSEPVDEIIQANPTLGEEVNVRLMEFAKSKGLLFSFVPNLFNVQRNVVEIQDFGGVPVVNIKNTPLDGWGKVVKRIFDIFFSSFALIVLSPLYLIIFLAVKLDTPGPAIYKALRGGKDKDFWFYKFRSMHAHLSIGLGGEKAEEVRKELWEKNDRGGKDGPFLKVKNDPRITRVGKFIRKTKLDELPQFWNVLKGDMSLVGPRAHVLDEVERYRNSYGRMFSIKPGVFGVSQNAQLTWPDLPFEEEIRLNTYYIENWSLMLDFKIMLKSAYLILFASKTEGDY